MAEFEYEEVNGRKIRVRPTEAENEIDEYGNFHRQKNRFTTGFGEGKNPVEADRYILFWGKGCNWSNRASIVRELLGLDVIKVEIVAHDPTHGKGSEGAGEKPAPSEGAACCILPQAKKPETTPSEGTACCILPSAGKKDEKRFEHKSLGWEFVNSPGHVNPETGAQFLSELYYNADPDYAGRTTVPALVDYKTKKVVNNDYHRLTNYFEVDFKPFHKKGAPDLYPVELRDEIDALNDWLFDNVNNAVYRAQFAQSLQAFADGYETFFAGLDQMDERLADRRFLFGDYVTDSDVRLYTTLARLDVNYSRNIGPCKHRLVDYKNLWPYARDLWQIPAFAHNTYFKDIINRTQRGCENYFDSTYYDIVLPDTDFDAMWGADTGREALSSDPGHKFRV